jgi:hypothetical protein
VLNSLKLGTLGLVAALSRTILAIATLGYIDEEDEEESTGGNGGGSGLKPGWGDQPVSYPDFFTAPARKQTSHAELYAFAVAAGF